MHRILPIIRIAAIAITAMVGARASILTNPPGQLSPVSGDLSGYDGSTVTWGLSLFNNTNDPTVSAVPEWWVITGVTADYTSLGIPGEIPGGPNFFTDLLSPYFFTDFFLNGEALAPGQDLNLASPGSPVDLASFAISPTADPGTISAQLHISYDIWDSNPFDPANTSATQLGSGVFDVDTSVTALGPAPSSAPEPGGSWIMAVNAMFLAAGVVLLKRRTRLHRAP